MKISINFMKRVIMVILIITVSYQVPAQINRTAGLAIKNGVGRVNTNTNKPLSCNIPSLLANKVKSKGGSSNYLKPAGNSSTMPKAVYNSIKTGKGNNVVPFTGKNTRFNSSTSFTRKTVDNNPPTNRQKQNVLYLNTYTNSQGKKHGIYGTKLTTHPKHGRYVTGDGPGKMNKGHIVYDKSGQKVYHRNLNEKVLVDVK